MGKKDHKRWRSLLCLTIITMILPLVGCGTDSSTDQEYPEDAMQLHPEDRKYYERMADQMKSDMEDMCEIEGVDNTQLSAGDYTYQISCVYYDDSTLLEQIYNNAADVETLLEDSSYFYCFYTSIDGMEYEGEFYRDDSDWRLIGFSVLEDSSNHVADCLQRAEGEGYDQVYALAEQAGIDGEIIIKIKDGTLQEMELVENGISRYMREEMENVGRYDREQIKYYLDTGEDPRWP